jgi:hypothetical protein
MRWEDNIKMDFWEDGTSYESCPMKGFNVGSGNHFIIADTC